MLLKFQEKLEKIDIFINGTTERIANASKGQKGGFLNIFLGTLSASLLGNMLVVKGAVPAAESVIRAGKKSSVTLSINKL